MSRIAQVSSTPASGQFLKYNSTSRRFDPVYGEYVLARSAIPFVIVPTGSMANNGVITLGTALPGVYANAYVNLPANAIQAGSAAGWYFAQFSSTTVGVVFNNTYVAPGVPAIPATPTAFVSTGPGAYTGVIVQVTGPQVSIPAGALGPNGVLRLSSFWNVTGNTNSKTITQQVGGTNVHNLALNTAAQLGYTMIRTIYARGVQTNQLMPAVGESGGGVGAQSGIADFLAVNLAVAQTFALLGTLAVATDFIVMEAFIIEVLPG